MAKAFKCSITGKLAEGNGSANVVVQISKTLRLTVIPHELDGGSFVNGALSDEGAAKITEVLQKQFGKPEPEEKK